MPKKKLTDVSIKAIKPTNAQTDYWDQGSTEANLALRVTPKGRKAWVTQPRVLEGGKWKAVRITFGEFPAIGLKDAREKAAALTTEAKRGHDPKQLVAEWRGELVKISAESFAAVRERFINNQRATTKKNGKPRKSVDEYERVLSGKAFENWEGMPIADIRKRDVVSVIDGIAKRTPIMANRALAYLRRMMNWAVSKDIIDVPPTLGVAAPSGETPRDRNLTDDEIIALRKLLDADSGLFASVVKLLLLTGQRKSEVAGMSWDEIKTYDELAGTVIPKHELPDDLTDDDRVWLLPTERSKNGEPHLIPLPPQALAILETVPKMKGCDLVFSTTGETSISGWSAFKKRLDTKLDIPHWQVHDLRRTVGTGLNGRLSIPPHIVEAVLNHLSGAKAGVAGVYNRAAYLRERRSALFAWADYIDRIMDQDAGGASDNVVPLRGA